MRKQIRLVPLLLLFLIGQLPAMGQINKIEFQEFTLDNGLHVILHEDHTTPVVGINVMYHVGSKNELPDRTGFAHFFEHLMFEGSPNIARGEYFKLIQNAGGENNAFTSFDKTDYYEVLPSNQVALGIWMESERMLHLKIDTVGLETQRKVVKEERKQRYENQPYGSFMSNIFDLAFKNTPYQWVPIGEAQYIDQAKLSEFRDFYKHYYVPENASLAIAGDIDPVKTRKLVEEYFGTIPGGKETIVRPEFKEPENPGEIRKTVYDNIQLPAVFMAYRMPAEGTDDYYALSMLQTLLSGGQSSRLYKSLVDEQQKALQVAAFPYALEDGGIFILLGLANMGVELPDLEKAIEEQIALVKSDGLTEKEFEKLQNQTETDFVSQNSTQEGIAQSLNNYYTFFGDPNLINTEINRYLAVTKEDIVRVAKKYLTKDNRVVLYYLPKSAENKEEK